MNVYVLDAWAVIAYLNVSVADSIALELAKSKKATLVTADHHEFDSINQAHELEFYWIR